MSQLKMIFNVENTPLPELTIADGFRLRTIHDEELAAYNELRVSVEFPAWEEAYLKDVYRKKVLADGLYLIEEVATGRFAASAAIKVVPPCSMTSSKCSRAAVSSLCTNSPCAK